MKITKTLLTLGTMAFSLSANAALLISDLDLNSQTFEVDSLASNTSATGTSNGIGYTMTMTTGTYYIPFSNTASSQSYNELPNSYDDLHLGNDFTITFNQPIDYLLVALANDNNTGDGPNFGLTPSDSTDVSITGTQIAITDIRGALVLYEFGAAISSISHINNNILDGWDVSFFAGTNAISQVPIPAAAFMFAPALLGFLGLRRKAKNTVA